MKKSLSRSFKARICIFFSPALLFTLCLLNCSVSSGRLYLDKVYRQTLSNATKYVVAVDDDGNVWAWGSDRIDLGMHSNLFPKSTSDTPVKIRRNTDIVSVVADYYCRMYIMKDGSLWFEGRNPIALVTRRPNLELTKIAENVISAACGNDHCAYVTSDGSLYMWGYNDYGQLGDGTLEPCIEPKKMMDDVISVSISVGNTVALKRDGSVWEWKYPGKEFGKPRVPTKVMDDAIYVSAGSHHCAAIKADNSLWVWGDNSKGKLGNGEYSVLDGAWNKIVDKGSDEPIKIMDDVVLVQADWENTAALKKDGSLWLWGSKFEDIYNATKVPVAKPKKILDDVAGFSLGASTIYCIKKDGSVLSMGDPGIYNRSGITGLGTDEIVEVPTPIGLKVRIPGFVTLPGKTPFSDVPMGYPHEDAIKWANDNGIIEGYNGMFDPEGNLTEAHFVTMLTKYGRIPYDETYTGTHYADKFYNVLAPYHLPLEGFFDASAKDKPLNRGQIAQIIASVYGLDYGLEDAIMFMYANNLSSGMSVKERTVETYGRDFPLTRAAAASFLHKMSSVTRVIDAEGNIIHVKNREIIGLKK
jgi:hypothetical protein